MKKLLAVMLLAGTFAAAVCAEETKITVNQTTRVTIDVDYSVVAMDKVNTELNTGTNVTTLSKGLSAMLNLDLAIVPFFGVGVRGGYLYCMPASANYVLSIAKQTINASLIPLEVGANVNLELTSVPVSLMAGIYGGYGIANASYKSDYNALGQTVSFTQPYDGNAIVGEVLATISFKLASALSLNINGGYRLAKVTKLTQSEDVNYSVLGVTIPAGKKGDVLKDSSGNDLVYDYSGLNIGAGISMGF